MTLEEARKWLQKREAERYLADIDHACDEAIDAAGRNERALGPFAPAVVRDMNSLSRDLERAQDNFNAQVIMISAGRARDGNGASRACQRYIAALVALEEANARYDAFVQLRVVDALATFARAYVERMTALQRVLREASREVQQLRDDVRRAQRDVTTSEVQLALDAVLTLIGELLPELDLPARFIEAGAQMTVSMLLDEALGPSGPSPTGTVVNGIGALAGMVPRLEPKVGRLASAAGALNTICSDFEEVAAARRQLDAVERRMRELARALPELVQEVREGGRSLQVARALCDAAVRSARRQAEAYRSSEGEYRALQRELASIR